jgi:23S rRNA pseudouridine2457 synthase
VTIFNLVTAFFMENFAYYIIYKPFNMLSQFTAEGDHQTLADLAHDFEKDVYPVGRLDYNSEGLLLLTNDGSLNKKMLHPSNKVSKTYYVQVEGEANEDQLNKLRAGVSFKAKGKTYTSEPAEVIALNDVKLPERNPPIRVRANIPTTWLAITITEGKNRQVRKMTAAVDLPTLRLVRWSIGKVLLGTMQPGETKALQEHILFNKLSLTLPK